MPLADIAAFAGCCVELAAISQPCGDENASTAFCLGIAAAASAAGLDPVKVYV